MLLSSRIVTGTNTERRQALCGSRCTSVAELPASLSRLRRLQTLAVACGYVPMTAAPSALGGPALQACRFKRVRFHAPA